MKTRNYKVCPIINRNENGTGLFNYDSLVMLGPPADKIAQQRDKQAGRDYMRDKRAMLKREDHRKRMEQGLDYELVQEVLDTFVPTPSQMRLTLDEAKAIAWRLQHAGEHN